MEVNSKSDDKQSHKNYLIIILMRNREDGRKSLKAEIIEDRCGRKMKM